MTFPKMCVVVALAAAVSQAAAAQRVHVSESAAESLLNEKVDPPSAKSAKVRGTVVLKVEIGKTGLVEDVTLVSGDPLLAPAAT
ncbi:MAG TPA: energy transducer TonB, partial [Terriglobales bacterium]|nr:energy transducer TonB [Terriglobales bacterium]